MVHDQGKDRGPKGIGRLIFLGVGENQFCGEGQKMEGTSIRRGVLKILGLKREEGAPLSKTLLVAL